MNQQQRPLAPAGPIDHQGPSLYEDLRRGLTHIHHNPEPQMAKNWYSCLYSIALALLQPWDERRRNIIQQNYVLISPYEKIYQDMSRFLADFLHERAEDILSRDPQVRFHLYLYEWESYNKMAANVGFVLSHMNEQWAERQIRAGIRWFPVIHTFYCLQWHDHLWTKVRDSVVMNAEQVIHKDNDGSVKFDNIVKGFPSMKVDGKWTKVNQVNLLEILEAPFTSPINLHNARVDHYIDQENLTRIAGELR
ncbi:unnamed protein product [Fusarium graminearum]|nr:unnamed protein product [Fusarium graminearum]